MSLAEILQQLIESHESRIRDYEGRIEKMEKDKIRIYLALMNIIPLLN